MSLIPQPRVCKSSYSVNGARPHLCKSSQGSRPNRPANTVGARRLRMAEDVVPDWADLIGPVPSGSDGRLPCVELVAATFRDEAARLLSCPYAVSVRRVTHGRGI